MAKKPTYVPTKTEKQKMKRRISSAGLDRWPDAETSAEHDKMRARVMAERKAKRGAKKAKPKKKSTKPTKRSSLTGTHMERAVTSPKSKRVPNKRLKIKMASGKLRTATKRVPTISNSIKKNTAKPTSKLISTLGSMALGRRGKKKKAAAAAVSAVVAVAKKAKKKFRIIPRK